MCSTNSNGTQNAQTDMKRTAAARRALPPAGRALVGIQHDRLGQVRFGQPARELWFQRRLLGNEHAAELLRPVAVPRELPQLPAAPRLHDTADKPFPLCKRWRGVAARGDKHAAELR